MSAVQQRAPWCAGNWLSGQLKKKQPKTNHPDSDLWCLLTPYKHSPKAGFKLLRAYSLVAGKRPGATHARPLACARPPNAHTAPQGKPYGRFHVTEQETDSGRVSDPGKVRPLGEWPRPTWKLGGNPQALPFPAPPMLFRHGRHLARSRACPHRLRLLPRTLQCPGSHPCPTLSPCPTLPQPAGSGCPCQEGA